MFVRYCCIALLLSACARDTAKVVRVNNANRRWLPVSFDTVWTVGGNVADSTLGFPARLTSLDGLVIVSDLGLHRILALRASSGAVAWMRGPEQGHAFKRPLIVWAQPGHRIAVVDETANRLTILDTAGRTVREVNLDPTRMINAGCTIKSGTTLVNSIDDLGPFYALAADGKTATSVPLTYLNAKGQEKVVLQAVLEGDGDGTRCVVGMGFGGGLALWNGLEFTHSTPFREPVRYPEPVMRTGTRLTSTETTTVKVATLPPRAVEGALDVAMTPGRIRVLFGGASTEEGRIVDDYDDQTLAYLGSALLPFRVGEFAAPSPDVLVVLTKHNGFFMLVALRQRAHTP